MARLALGVVLALIAAALGLPISAATTGASATVIALNGQRPGAVFDGLGAISGGGGNSRLLIDYPAMQRTQILNYLFGPGGADLQLLKLEIGGDANTSDGAEPSIEHAAGQVSCDVGYEWWLAKQAVARNPQLKLYGLQWAAPGWVGTIWSQADIGYLLNWLNCAKSHGLTISYLGGWNEHGYDASWFEQLRQALDANGYRSVKIVAADAHPTINPYDPASAWAVANAAAADPTLKQALSVIGVHDTCGNPTSGYSCEVTTAARKLGLPLWESELGGMDANTGAADLIRAINHGAIAGLTGYLEWPLLDSMPPGLLYENRGLVTADQPWSGSYVVDRMTWAIAQLTQFVKPGWRELANGLIGDSGSYSSYESPDHRDWSLIAENTGQSAGRDVTTRQLTVRLSGELKNATVHVWATNLTSANPATWFVRRADVHPRDGAFSYAIPPGYVISFTSTSGQSRYRTRPPPPASLKLPYRASRDASAEAWGLSSQEGAFSYQPCGGVSSGDCLVQMAPQSPVWWHSPPRGLPTPYAIVGAANWTSYTVTANISFPASAGTASLIGRFGTEGSDAQIFTGYECNVQANGHVQLTRNSSADPAHVLRAGSVPALVPDTWHAMTFTLNGPQLSCGLDGKIVVRIRDTSYLHGLAGIGTSWNLIKFSELEVDRTAGVLT